MTYALRLSPMAHFHWRAAVPGALVLAAIAVELCCVAVWLARVVAP